MAHMGNEARRYWDGKLHCHSCTAVTSFYPSRLHMISRTPPRTENAIREGLGLCTQATWYIPCLFELMEVTRTAERWEAAGNPVKAFPHMPVKCAACNPLRKPWRRLRAHNCDWWFQSGIWIQQYNQDGALEFCLP